MNTIQKDFYLTKDGVQRLKDELNDLIHTQRPAVAARLKEAKSFGDLSENAEYEGAKDQQAFIEGRISEIEHILKHHVLIEAPKKKDSIDLGSTVHLQVEDGKQVYTIVGSTEANPTEGKISNESPIGRALLGKKKGEQIEVDVPSGTMTYKIVHVE